MEQLPYYTIVLGEVTHWYTIHITLDAFVRVLWPLPFGWLSVLGLYMYMEDYLQFFKSVSFWLYG